MPDKKPPEPTDPALEELRESLRSHITVTKRSHFVVREFEMPLLLRTLDRLAGKIK